MENGEPETNANEQTQTEYDRKQPAAQWKEIFSGAWQDFSPKHLSNLIFLIVGLLASPTIGYFMKQPKIIIGGSALAVTILIWLFAYHLMKQVDDLPDAPKAEKIDKMSTHTAPPATTSTQQPKESISSHEKTKMTNDQPKNKPSITQTMTNSPGSIQAGRDVNIHHGPQSRRLNEEQFSQIRAILNQAPKSKAIVNFAINSAEALSFAQQLVQVLTSAGWNATLGNPTIEHTPVNGVGLFVHSKDNLAAGALQHALGEVKFPAQGFVNPELPEGHIGIFIAPRN